MCFINLFQKTNIRAISTNFSNTPYPILCHSIVVMSSNVHALLIRREGIKEEEKLPSNVPEPLIKQTILQSIKNGTISTNSPKTP